MSPPANPEGSVLKLYLESGHFSPPHPPWAKLPLSGLDYDESFPSGFPAPSLFSAQWPVILWLTHSPVAAHFPQVTVPKPL